MPAKTPTGRPRQHASAAAKHRASRARKRAQLALLKRKAALLDEIAKASKTAALRGRIHLRTWMHAGGPDDELIPRALLDWLADGPRNGW